MPLVRSAIVALALFAIADDASAWLDRLALERQGAALVSSDRAARREAARRLGREGPGEAAVDALLGALARETDPEVRAEIVDALARRRDPRAVAALTENVQRLRTAEREARVRALAAIDDTLARRALAASLGGPAGELAEARVVELGAPMVDELVPLLDAPASAARAARALGVIADPRGVDALIAHAGIDDPALRAAVLGALEAAGDERGAPAALAAIDHPDAAVAIAALRALARLGSRDAGAAVEAQLGREGEAIAHEALRTLAAIDPPRAVAPLERALDASPRGAAWAVILERPDASFVPLLARAADEAPGEAADALGRVEAGAGVPALVELARGQGGARAALAIALRRWPGLDGGLRGRALAVLRSGGDAERALWLRAIARDHDARDPLIARILSDAAPARAIAARALATLGARDDAVRDALAAAAARETDEVAREAESEALAVLGARLALSEIVGLDDPARALAALRLTSIARAPASPHEARERRRAVLAALRSPSARIRANAAHALAGDPHARSALAAALEDDAPEVRRAAAHALARLAAGSEPRIADRLASRLAIEPDPAARRAMRDALAGAAPSTAGDTCLHLQLDRPGSTVVELVLPEGRWIRERSLESGELVVCDLPQGEVDVRLAP